MMNFSVSYRWRMCRRKVNPPRKQHFLLENAIETVVVFSADLFGAATGTAEIAESTETKGSSERNSAEKNTHKFRYDKIQIELIQIELIETR